MTFAATIIGSCDGLIDALTSEFGSVLAQRILEAEAADFLWDARVVERYLGEHVGLGIDDGNEAGELSQIAILSLVDGCWYAGSCLVDGEGHVSALLWQRRFDSRAEAEIEFLRIR